MQTSVNGSAGGPVVAEGGADKGARVLVASGVVVMLAGLFGVLLIAL